MLYKLALALAFALPALYAAAEGPETTSLLWFGVIVLVLGYHRNLLADDAETPPWGRIVIPDRESMRVRYSIWGIPLAPARRVRHGRRLRERAVASPGRARVLEALPAAFRWLARKAGA